MGLLLVLVALSTATLLRDGPIPFSYDKHGQDWEMGACASRDAQSPVNFDLQIFAKPTAKFSFYYRDITEKIPVKTQGKQLRYVLNRMNAGSAFYAGTEYKLQELRFHANSEHTIRGERFPIEMQMVHRSSLGKLLVIAVFFTCTEKPPMPTSETKYKEADPDEVDFDLMFNNLIATNPLSDIPTIPEDNTVSDHFAVGKYVDGTFLAYAGSLTTPPCSEVATWLVKREPVTLSAGQVAAMQAVAYEISEGFGNWRAVMPLGARTEHVLVVESGRAGDEPQGTFPLPLGPNARTDGELRAVAHAKYAGAASAQTQGFAEDFERRIAAASKKQGDFYKMRLKDVKPTDHPQATTTENKAYQVQITTDPPAVQAFKYVKLKMDTVNQKVASSTVKHQQRLAVDWLLKAVPSVGGGEVVDSEFD